MSGFLPEVLTDTLNSNLLSWAAGYSQHTTKPLWPSSAICLLVVLFLTTCDSSCLLTTWQMYNHTGDKALIITGREFLNWANWGWLESEPDQKSREWSEPQNSSVFLWLPCDQTDVHTSTAMTSLPRWTAPQKSLAPRTVKANLSLTKAFPKQAFVRYFVKVMRKVTNTLAVSSVTSQDSVQMFTVWGLSQILHVQANSTMPSASSGVD